MNKEGVTSTTVIIEQATTVRPRWRQEMIRLYEEGFCLCEPYWETDPEETVSTELKAIANDQNLSILTASERNGLAGFLITSSVSPERFEGMVHGNELQRETENDIYLLELAVDKRFRRTGLGSQLVGKAIECAERFGKSGVVLRADLRNTPAIRLYRKLGFCVLTEGTGSNPFDVYIRKNLSGFEGGATQAITTRCTQTLFDSYPLAEYLFFTGFDEIAGWRRATRSEAAPNQLSYDSGQWKQTLADAAVDFQKIVWAVKR